MTSDCPYRRTFHSDQGWAYQMKSYTKRLKEERIFQSMSRKGNCLDNSVMENFFGLLKQEIYYGRIYHSYEESISFTKMSIASRNLSAGSVQHSIVANISPHRKSAGFHFPTLSGLTFGRHYSFRFRSFYCPTQFPPFILVRLKGGKVSQFFLPLPRSEWRRCTVFISRTTYCRICSRERDAKRSARPWRIPFSLFTELCSVL